MVNKCHCCGLIHETLCSMVKAIEYFEDGVTVKRIEFKTAVWRHGDIEVVDDGRQPRAHLQ
jgi:hypothetical protein